MIELHYNWFLFSIIFWTTGHFQNNFQKNNKIFNLINNLITILFIGVSINYNHESQFLIYSLNEENVLDIYSVFSVYLNIGFILLDLIVNRNIIYNLSMLILLSGYVYGGYFNYLIYIYFSFQFLKIIDNITFLFKLKNKYILMFNLFFRFGLLFFILFNWMIVNIESDKSTKELIPNYIFIPFYWNFIGSILIFMIIFYNISIMFLSLDNLGFV